jgi:hypothetical protein
MSIVTRRMKPGDRAALDTFLATEPEATAFHRPEWHDVIRATYGHECDYWLALRGADIAGVFPVAHVRVPLLGSKTIAMPYQMYSGAPIGRRESFEPLVTAAIEQARSAGAKYLEIRHHEEAAWLGPLGFEHVDSGLVTTSVPLDGLSLQQAAHGHRQRVRKAERQGVDIVETQDADEWRTFRRMYLETGRAMGAPQAGWSFFANLREHAAGLARLYMARHEGRTVGGFLVFGDGRVSFARCSAHSSSESFAVNAGQALWWRALTDAAAAGTTRFNCGITWIGDAGLIKWKEGWGGESGPVHLYVLPIRSDVPEPGSYFEGYKLAKAVWRRLPIPVVDVVGHAVTRWIG